MQPVFAVCFVLNIHHKWGAYLLYPNIHTSRTMTDLRRNRYSISAGVGKSVLDSLGKFYGSPKRQLPNKFEAGKEYTGYNAPWIPFALDWLKQGKYSSEWIAMGSLNEEPNNMVC